MATGPILLKRARSLGFSVEEVRDLPGLWRDKTRTSLAVKALASRHLEALDRKIEEIRSMRKTLADLVRRCRGDDRPACPILDDLGDSEEAQGGQVRPNTVKGNGRSRRRR